MAFATAASFCAIPQHGAFLGRLFIKTMMDMGMCGTTPDKRGRFSHIISSTHAGLFAMELALSDPDARAAAVALSFKYNLGPIMIAACVFGTFDDVLALTYPLTLAIIGKPDAYRDRRPCRSYPCRESGQSLGRRRRSPYRGDPCPRYPRRRSSCHRPRPWLH